MAVGALGRLAGAAYFRRHGPCTLNLHAAFRALSPRGGPIRAGWNRTAAASVQTSARAISLPMLDMPGWSESQRLPNAVAVVSALKNTARVRVDCSRLVRPAHQAMM